MRITVVTPSFNQARFLERTLESIHSQSGDFDLEHLVIDGGSTDGSVEILQKWADRLWFVSEPDRGQSSALNKGFARATGDVIGWLNSDDLYMPGSLARVADCFRNHIEARWLFGKCRIIDTEDREIRRSVTRYKNLLSRNYSYGLLLTEDFINQPATFFRRDLLEQAGPLNEDLHFVMDYDLWLRFARICPPHRLDAELAAFRFYSDSKTGGRIEDSLREANTVSRKFSAEAGRPWIGALNYWWYYKRTSLIYRLMDRMNRP